MIRERERNLAESGSKAEVACRQALAKAGFAFSLTPATFHWSQLINPRGSKASAIDAYLDLLQQEPENASALEGLAFLYQLSGQQLLAQDTRKKLYATEARQFADDVRTQSEVITYLMAKTGNADAPSRVPAVVVQSLFDKYADSFDEHLIQQLEYSAPQTIASLVCKLKDTINLEKGLDLGCGTGLAGVYLQSLLARIDGVDLSAKMLDKARERNIYTQLLEADFLTTVSLPQNEYNLVVTVDVLMYHGDLYPVFEKVKHLLADNGSFIFSVEKIQGNNFVLKNTGRFQHSAGYVLQIAKQCNFKILHEQEAILRKEDGQPVVSLIYCLQK